LLPQVANGTGTAAFRHCDALALSLWPSRGLHLHGFEIKTYRGDWLRELKNPAKAEDIAQFCNYWWIVTNTKVVDEFELPHGWGLLEWNEKRQQLHQKTKATFREPLKKPDVSFIAGVLRKAQDVMTPDSVIAEACKAAKDEGFKEGVQRNSFANDQLQELKQKVSEFEMASGLAIARGYQGGKKIGEAVKMVLAAEDWRLKENLLNAAHKIIDILEPT
jgi:hypothetical protein